MNSFCCLFGILLAQMGGHCRYVCDFLSGAFFSFLLVSWVWTATVFSFLRVYLFVNLSIISIGGCWRIRTKFYLLIFFVIFCHSDV